MKKFWMMGGAVIAVSVAAMTWNPGPVRSSENLLGKAQSEFAIKARDALIQRRMAQASPVTAPALAAADEPMIAAPEAAYVVASLGPVAAPKARQSVVPAAAATPETTTVAPDPRDTPVEAPKLSAAPEFPASPAVENKPATEPQQASPEAPVSENVVAAKPTIRATAPEPIAVVSPTAEATPREPAKPAHKARRPRNEPRTNTVAYRDRSSSGYSTSYNLGALRAHAPQIAAAIARYM
jgi:hypothetical protein